MNEKINSFFKKNESYTLYKVVKGGIVYIVSNRPVNKCPHVEGIELNLITGDWSYRRHTPVKKSELSESLKINNMIVTQENLIRTYINYPEYRPLLNSLYGEFLSDESKRIIEQEDEITRLKEELSNCKKIK